MADISALTNLTQEAEPLDLEMYPDARESAPLPKKGEYTLQAPDSFPATAFGTTKKGSLSAQIDPIILGPTNENYKIRYAKVSAKVFKRNGLPASQVGDYLRACGIKGKVSADPQELADAVERTANTVYRAQVDWRAYHTGTGFQVEGMERFPSDGNGGHLPYFPHPTEKELDDNGIVVKDEKGIEKPLRLRAQLQITRFIPAA
jgi:hypothetical protein